MSGQLTRAGDPGANKWYQSHTSAIVGLTAGDDGRLEIGDSSGAAVAAQTRQEVVVRTMREVSGTSWPTLTRTNYDEWAVTMKVKLRARQL